MAQKQLAHRTSSRAHIPQSAWKRIEDGHEPDGELSNAFFDTKVELIFGYTTDIKSYCKHSVNDARAAVYRKQMEESTGTKAESISIMKYFLGFSRGQLKNLATGIRLRHFQSPQDLPDYSEIFDHTEDSDTDARSRSVSVSTADSSSIDTIVPSNKQSFQSRQESKRTTVTNIGRAIKIYLLKDLEPKNPKSLTYKAESHILYEYSSSKGQGLCIENLYVFQKNNKTRTSNDKKIKDTLASWKHDKVKYSPLKPDTMINLEFQHLVNRKNKEKREQNKIKRRQLKDFLKSYRTVDLKTFKKESDVIGEDHKLEWDDGASFKKDVVTAFKEFKELIEKKSGFGLGSQWTLDIRRNPTLPIDDEGAEKTAEDTTSPKPKKPKKSLPRL